MVRSKRQSRCRGFTLVELIFAITILSFLATITAGALKQTAAGNRRVACMTNLHNLHQALRMYKLDEGRYPARDGTAGWGLWALFTYGEDPQNPISGGNPDLLLSAPESGYLGSNKSLHCPEDKANSQQTDSANPLRHNPNYCSYQVLDPITPSGATTTDRYTYQPYRGQASTSADYQRQLWNGAIESSVSRDWHPQENTVLTWCLWHRDRAKPAGYDLVLFLDGQVDFVAMPDPATTTSGWKRLPVQGTVQ
jgi:prepilin-type N-terminal cleavage/methylation domain-containing protein